jgi:hypothetical protein
MAIAHQADDGTIVLDLVREVQPPFQTNLVAAEFAEIMRRYGISSAVSDRVGYGWVSQTFYDEKDSALEPASVATATSSAAQGAERGEGCAIIILPSLRVTASLRQERRPLADRRARPQCLC